MIGRMNINEIVKFVLFLAIFFSMFIGSMNLDDKRFFFYPIKIFFFTFFCKHSIILYYILIVLENCGGAKQFINSSVEATIVTVINLVKKLTMNLINILLKQQN